jgi:hypothetical protein
VLKMPLAGGRFPPGVESCPPNIPVSGRGVPKPPPLGGKDAG